MPMPTKSVLLADQTSGVNAAQNVDVVAADFDSLFIEYNFDIALPAATTAIEFKDLGAGTSPTFQAASASAGDVGWYCTSWSLAASTLSSGRYKVGLPAPLPPPVSPATNPNVRIVLTAAGVGVTTRCRVWGRREFRGPSVTADETQAD